MNISSKLTPGNLLQNRYRIESVLGQGGFGAVYQAYDVRLHKMVALKETVPQDPDFLRQFEREAQLLARLQHPALPAVTDYFTESSAYYLVMTYIPGEDLSAWLDRQLDHRVSEADALILIAPVLNALEYLHTQQPPIIHRDIKPDNVRIDPESEVYLVDFGLAKAYSPSLKTTIGARALTPGFAPIEQYGAGTTDPRTDLYAVGAMLYVMLSGVKELPEAPDRLVNDTLVPLRQIDPSISPTMEQVVMRLLAIQPQDRYPDVAAVRQVLLGMPQAPERLATGKRAPSEPLSEPAAQTGPTVVLPQPLTRVLPRQQSFWSVTGVIGGLLLIAGMMTMVAMLIIGEVLPANITYAPTRTPAPTHTRVPETVTPIPIPYHPPHPVTIWPTERSGSETGSGDSQPTLDRSKLPGRLVFHANHEGSWHIYTMRFSGSSQMRLTHHPSLDMYPDWSPDGELVAFQSTRDGNSEIYLVSTYHEGEPQNLTRNRANDESPVWSPDGKRIAFVSDRDGGNRQLYVMDTDDYQAEPLTTSDNVTDAALPEWSPDGKYIAFVQSTDQGGTDISILNIETGEMENITQNPGQVDTAPAWSPDGKRMLFQSERSGNNDIFVMNIGEGFSGLDNLTEHPANDTLPCWSPDGEYIVFQSNRDGNNSLYVMRADGTQQTSLTGNNTGASEDAADWHE